jgi:hypothetical protein
MEDKLEEEKTSLVLGHEKKNAVLALIEKHPDLGLALKILFREWFEAKFDKVPPYNFEVKRAKGGVEWHRCSVNSTIGLFKGNWSTDIDFAESTCVALLFGQLLTNEYSEMMVNQGGYMDMPSLEAQYNHLVTLKQSSVAPVGELNVVLPDLQFRLLKLQSSRVTKQSLVDDPQRRARRAFGENLLQAWVAKQELLQPDGGLFGNYEFGDFYTYVHGQCKYGIVQFYEEIARSELEVIGGGFSIVEKWGHTFCDAMGSSNPTPLWLKNRKAVLTQRLCSSGDVASINVPTPQDSEMDDS